MPWPLYPQRRATGTHWRGGWVDPSAGLEVVEKRKIHSPSPSTIIQPVTLRHLGSILLPLLLLRWLYSPMWTFNSLFF